MKRSAIIILIFLIAIVAIGCTSLNLLDEPAELSITIGDKKIEYVVGKNIWNGAIFDREDTFQTILKQSSGIEIPIIDIDEFATIKFINNTPDKITVYDILIDENGNQIYTDNSTAIIPVKLNNNQCTFKISKHIASYLSSYYEHNQINYRGFRVVANWGENECEYGFIIRTKEQSDMQEINNEERQKIDLYTEVMKAAFLEENGGDLFISVKSETLEGLSNNAKKLALEELKELSPNVYNFDDIKNDNTKFELDTDGGLIRAIDGTLLWIELEEYNENKAKITGVSWFGNLGAVFPTYEAIYKNGAWELKLVSMAVS